MHKFKFVCCAPHINRVMQDNPLSDGLKMTTDNVHPQTVFYH